MDCDCFRAVSRKISRNQPAEIFSSAINDDGLSSNSVIGHVVRVLL
jgi:hypothetical protein